MANSGNGIHIIRKLCWFTHDFSLAKGVKKKSGNRNTVFSQTEQNPSLKCCTGWTPTCSILRKIKVCSRPGLPNHKNAPQPYSGLDPWQIALSSALFQCWEAGISSRLFLCLFNILWGRLRPQGASVSNWACFFLSSHYCCSSTPNPVESIAALVKLSREGLILHAPLHCI